MKKMLRVMSLELITFELTLFECIHSATEVIVREKMQNID